MPFFYTIQFFFIHFKLYYLPICAVKVYIKIPLSSIVDWFKILWLEKEKSNLIFDAFFAYEMIILE